MDNIISFLFANGRFKILFNLFRYYLGFFKEKINNENKKLVVLF